METDEFWRLVESARRRLPDQPDAEDVAETMVELLSELPAPEIAAYDEPLWELMDVSYRENLWGAAYIVLGGASDDAFDYFRGWLIAQGQTVFERALADPDSLADHPAIIEGALEGEADAWGEEILSVVSDAYQAVADAELPANTSARVIPDLHDGWDFDDEDQMREHLPRLAVLYYD